MSLDQKKVLSLLGIGILTCLDIEIILISQTCCACVFCCLQADFANKFIGGGVLGRGCVQEEIRFMVCPELIVSRLFMEMMLEKESIVIVGAERFSFYSGYASSFLWTGPYSDTTPFDKWRRRNTTVLALDALVFHNKAAQFKKPALTRELVKAYCAFKRSTGVPRDYQVAVATGNWGCGAFGGEPYLKALLQLIATSAASRQLLYFTFGNSKLSTDLLELHRALRANNTTVAALWQGILTYSEIYPAPAGGRHLYSFLHRRLCCDESGESEGTEPLSSEGTDVAYSEATELPCSEECVVPCSDEAELPLSEDTAEAAAACLDDSAPLFSDPGEDMGSPAPSSPHLLAGVTRSEDVSRRTQTSGDEPGTVTTSGEWRTPVVISDMTAPWWQALWLHTTTLLLDWGVLSSTAMPLHKIILTPLALIQTCSTDECPNDNFTRIHIVVHATQTTAVHRMALAIVLTYPPSVFEYM